MAIGTRWNHRKSWTSRSTWIAGKKPRQSEHIRLKFTSTVFAKLSPKNNVEEVG